MGNKAGISVNHMKRPNLGLSNYPINLSIDNEAIDILIEEGGEAFYNYVDWLGFIKEPELIVLSSTHHYYYDTEEMNNFKTVINIKELNLIKNIRNFLQPCLDLMPQKSNFIGCFTDNEKIKRYELRNSSSNDKKRSLEAIEYGIVSNVPFINFLYSIMDLRTIRYISKYNISSLLDDYGFKVIDMTEFNGLTYFHSQKIQTNYN